MGTNRPMISTGKKAKPFDAAKYLDSDEAVAEYFSEALRTQESDTIGHAISVAAKARANCKRQ